MWEQYKLCQVSDGRDRRNQVGHNEERNSEAQSDSEKKIESYRNLKDLREFGHVEPKGKERLILQV